MIREETLPSPSLCLYRVQYVLRRTGEVVKNPKLRERLEITILITTTEKVSVMNLICAGRYGHSAAELPPEREYNKDFEASDSPYAEQFRDYVTTLRTRVQDSALIAVRDELTSK